MLLSRQINLAQTYNLLKRHLVHPKFLTEKRCLVALRGMRRNGLFARELSVFSRERDGE